MVRPLRRAIGLVATTLLFALAGCGHSIGDPCNSNVDCSPAGDRFCDRSVVGGYCTVEGCDINTCPDSQPCVRFFVPYPDDADRCGPTMPCARSDERCITDEACLVSPAPASCAVSSGHCAPETTERRWCMHGCANDGDCRPGFECRSTVNGATPNAPALQSAFPVPTLNNPLGDPSSFCVQAG